MAEALAEFLDGPTVTSCRHARLRAAMLIKRQPLIDLETGETVPDYEEADRSIDENLTILEFLKTCRHMGQVKAIKVLDRAAVNPGTPFVLLTKPEQQRIVNALKPF